MLQPIKFCDVNHIGQQCGVVIFNNVTYDIMWNYSLGPDGMIFMRVGTPKVMHDGTLMYEKVYQDGHDGPQTIGELLCDIYHDLRAMEAEKGEECSPIVATGDEWGMKFSHIVDGYDKVEVHVYGGGGLFDIEIDAPLENMNIRKLRALGDLFHNIADWSEAGEDGFTYGL